MIKKADTKALKPKVIFSDVKFYLTNTQKTQDIRFTVNTQKGSKAGTRGCLEFCSVLTDTNRKLQ